MHEQHTILEPDSNFDSGTLAHLVIGNEGRVLDGRRTPGFIEHYDKDSAMFIWRITGFEDAGNCWEIPAEQINCYQFRKESSLLSQEEVSCISKRCQELNQTLSIPKSPVAYAQTEAAIFKQEKAAREWITQHSAFYQAGIDFHYDAKEGMELLFSDLEKYLQTSGLYELEKETAEQYLLNPYSGEWIKGLKIVMAEMGLIAYSGTSPRKKETFMGIGSKDNRMAYVIARTAFVRSIFKLKGITEIPLFRGMSSEIDFYETPQTLISTTLSAATAMEFADIKQSSKARSAYFVKFTCPVDKLFMTFFETRQFNERYKEQEAIIFYDNQIKF